MEQLISELRRAFNPTCTCTVQTSSRFKNLENLTAYHQNSFPLFSGSNLSGLAQGGSAARLGDVLEIISLSYQIIRLRIRSSLGAPPLATIQALDEISNVPSFNVREFDDLG
jgi:hypothetical protein